VCSDGVLGIERATLIAVLMAGEIALKCARTYPARVSALVLCTTGAGADAPTEAVQEIWRDADAAFEVEHSAGVVEVEARG
jgi:pimeloyl-ACP methyl ester carboxylesterase